MALSLQSTSYVGAPNPTAMPNAATFSSGTSNEEDAADREEWNTNDHQILSFLDSWEIIRWDQSVCFDDDDDDDDDVVGDGGEDDFDYNDCIPFQNTAHKPSWLLTAGYVLSAVIFLPMSLKDLKVCLCIVFNENFNNFQIEAHITHNATIGFFRLLFFLRKTHYSK